MAVRAYVGISLPSPGHCEEQAHLAISSLQALNGWSSPSSSRGQSSLAILEALGIDASRPDSSINTAPKKLSHFT